MTYTFLLERGRRAAGDTTERHSLGGELERGLSPGDGLERASRLEQGRSKERLPIGSGRKLRDVLDALGQRDRNRGGAEHVGETQRGLQSSVVLVEHQKDAVERAQLIDDLRAHVSPQQRDGRVPPATEREKVES